MSPERRTSIRPTKNQAEMQRRLHARPTFNSLFDLWKMAAGNLEDPSELNLLSNNRLLLAEYVEALLSTTVGKHKKMRRWKNEYEPKGKPIYDKGVSKYMGRARNSVLDPKPKKR